MKPYADKHFLATALHNKTYKQLEKELGVGKSTIHRYAQKYGLTKGVPPRWAGREVQRLKGHYTATHCIYSLFPNRSISSINHKASRLGLKRFVKPRSYHLNHKFFDSWTRESAYVLGWMFSDGNVAKTMRSFGFHLALKDVAILKIIRTIMESNQPIRVDDTSAYLRFNDKISCIRLVKLGCLPLKSSRMRLPEVPLKYLNHFVRGYFDGDGSIHFNQPNVIKVSFVSCSKSFLTDLQKRLKTGAGIPPYPLYARLHKNSLYSCSYYGDNARKLCNWMYRNSGKLRLPRKWKRFERHLKRRAKYETGHSY